jgi:uncharacterized protein YegL
MESMNSHDHAPLVLGKIDIPRQFAQLVLLVLDGSGSMSEQAVGNISKAQATNGAVRDLLTRLKVSRVAQNFVGGVVTFDNTVRERLVPTPMNVINDNDNYDPLVGHGGGTSICAALEQAERIVRRFLAQAPTEGIPHSAVILLMSDGCCSEPDKTRAVAQRIKSGEDGARITLACTLFATVGKVDRSGEQLLKDVATDPVRYFKTVYDGETLRNFLLASASAASGGIQIV